MIKKIALILLLYTNILPIEPIENKNIGTPEIITGLVAISIVTGTIYSADPAFFDFMWKTKKEDDQELVLAEKIIILAVGIAVGIFAIYKLHPIIKEIYDFMYPSPAEQIALKFGTHIAREQLALMKTRSEFSNCLMDALQSKLTYQISDDGYPKACQRAAKILKFLGDEKRVRELTKLFKKYK